MTDTTGAVVGRLFCGDQPRGVLLLSAALTADDRRRIERHIEASVTAAREQCSRDHAREREIWQRAMTRTEAALVKARADADRFESMVAEAYQIVGAMAQEFDCFEHPDVQRALDKFALYDEAQDDELLPWPREPLTAPSSLFATVEVAINGADFRLTPSASGADNPAAAPAASGVSSCVTGGVSDAESETPCFFGLGRDAG